MYILYVHPTFLPPFFMSVTCVLAFCTRTGHGGFGRAARRGDVQHGHQRDGQVRPDHRGDGAPARHAGAGSDPRRGDLRDFDTRVRAELEEGGSAGSFF